jgi:hypothetical protein
VQDEDFIVKTFKMKYVSETGTTASHCAITQACRQSCSWKCTAHGQPVQTTHSHFEGKLRNEKKIFFLNLTQGVQYIQDEVWYSVPNFHTSRQLQLLKLFYKKYIFLLTLLNLLIVAPRGGGQLKRD